MHSQNTCLSSTLRSQYHVLSQRSDSHFLSIFCLATPPHQPIQSGPACHHIQSYIHDLSFVACPVSCCSSFLQLAILSPVLSNNSGPLSQKRKYNLTSPVLSVLSTRTCLCCPIWFAFNSMTCPLCPDYTSIAYYIISLPSHLPRLDCPVKITVLY
jgi:hypothetical protein